MVINRGRRYPMNRSWQVLILIKSLLGTAICLRMQQVIILFILSGILIWRLSNRWWKSISGDFLEEDNGWHGRMTG